MTSAELRRLGFAVVPGVAGVAAAVVVVLLLVAFDAKSGPRLGDHWHAPYAIFVGDVHMPSIPEIVTPEGIHTHGDGIIHVHPHLPVAENSGARLEQFFFDMGGRLTDTEMTIPGTAEVFREGDDVDGAPAEIRILRADSGIHPLANGFATASEGCDAMPESAFQEVDRRYVVRDGDCIRIIFGPIAQ